jgi:hypothetical protein
VSGPLVIRGHIASITVTAAAVTHLEVAHVDVKIEEVV